ncbi:hypothetical protein BTO02_16930 [Paraburkholderia sp. SOS3]|jgi:hypothetical protein|nr:hypothetical protein BTO02_16930 [Paraburkholderia sp. SOS3]
MLSTMLAPMVHEIAGAAARERPRRGHKRVTIRECEARAHARLHDSGRLACAGAPRAGLRGRESAAAQHLSRSAAISSLKALRFLLR